MRTCLEEVKMEGLKYEERKDEEAKWRGASGVVGSAEDKYGLNVREGEERKRKRIKRRKKGEREEKNLISSFSVSS